MEKKKKKNLKIALLFEKRFFKINSNDSKRMNNTLKKNLKGTQMQI